MNDKEFNRSILAKLYEIADKVFKEGVNVPEGSYTASELVKMEKKEKIFSDGYITTKHVTKSYMCGYDTIRTDILREIAPLYSVKVGNFEASFCASKVFDLVARFENLAGFGKAKQRVFTCFDKDGLAEIGSVTVLLDNSMAEMAKYCKQHKICANEKYKMVALDFRNSKIVATNGHILNVRKLCVIEANGEIPSDVYPLIEYREFARLCKNAGKEGEAVKCSLIEEAGKQFWVCGGSKIEAKYWINYLKVFDSGIIKDKIVSLEDNVWKKVAKWIKQNNKIETTGSLFIYHQAGAGSIRFIIQNVVDGIKLDYTATCKTVPQDSFVLCHQREHLLTACKSFNLDISHKWKWAFSVCKDSVSIIMPYVFPNDCGLDFKWEITGEKTNIFDYCGFNDSEVHHEAQETIAMNDCAGIEDNTPCEAVSVPQNELPEENDNAPERETITARATKSKGKRFSLYGIGLNNGDTIQFVDGQIVTVCSDKKVAFEGKEYTLSGFTKSFILKPNKSGAYRGVMYFYKDGVRLDKYADAHLSDSQNIETSNTQQDKPSMQSVATKDETQPECCAASTEKPIVDDTPPITNAPNSVCCTKVPIRKRCTDYMLPVRLSKTLYARIVVLLNIVRVCGTERNPFALLRVPGYLFVGGGFANNTRVLYDRRLVAHKRRTTPVHALSNPPPCIYPRNGNKRTIRRFIE